jgi:hypothetical protein
VHDSNWAYPKADGGIRICGNYSATVKQYIRTDYYSVPLIDEILADFGG